MGNFILDKIKSTGASFFAPSDKNNSTSKLGANKKTNTNSIFSSTVGKKSIVNSNSSALKQKMVEDSIFSSAPNRSSYVNSTKFGINVQSLYAAGTAGGGIMPNIPLPPETYSLLTEAQYTLITESGDILVSK